MSRAQSVGPIVASFLPPPTLVPATLGRGLANRPALRSERPAEWQSHLQIHPWRNTPLFSVWPTPCAGARSSPSPVPLAALSLSPSAALAAGCLSAAFSRPHPCLFSMLASWPTPYRSEGASKSHSRTSVGIYSSHRPGTPRDVEFQRCKPGPRYSCSPLHSSHAEHPAP